MTKTEKKTPAKGSKTEPAKKESAKKTKPKQQQQPSEEDNLKRKEEYLGILKNFLDSPSLTYSFPTNLNSYERRLIHQICEDLSLNHCSEGTGKDRHIVIKKPTPEEEEKVENKEEEEEEKQDEEVLTAKEELTRKMQEMIDTFIDSPEGTLKLPSKMSAFERGVVRDVCEERGLTHQTEGKGKRRHIIVQKPDKTNTKSDHEDDRQTTEQDTNELPSTPQDTATVPNDIRSHSNTQGGAIPKAREENSMASLKKVRTRFVDGKYVQVEEGDSTATKSCAVCGRDVPLQNYSLHSVQCERRRRETQQDGTSAGRSVRIFVS